MVIKRETGSGGTSSSGGFRKIVRNRSVWVYIVLGLFLAIILYNVFGFNT